MNIFIKVFFFLFFAGGIPFLSFFAEIGVHS